METPDQSPRPPRRETVTPVAVSTSAATSVLAPRASSTSRTVTWAEVPWTSGTFWRSSVTTTSASPSPVGSVPSAAVAAPMSRRERSWNTGRIQRGLEAAGPSTGADRLPSPEVVVLACRPVSWLLDLPLFYAFQNRHVPWHL